MEGKNVIRSLTGEELVSKSVVRREWNRPCDFVRKTDLIIKIYVFDII